MMRDFFEMWSRVWAFATWCVLGLAGAVVILLAWVEHPRVMLFATIGFASLANLLYRIGKEMVE